MCRSCVGTPTSQSWRLRTARPPRPIQWPCFRHEVGFASQTAGFVSTTRPWSPPSVIDTFFRSLADDQDEAAIGILLSGSGTDGTLGIRALKERGAFAMVQSPDDAAYSGMPRSAVDTGLIDVVDDAVELGATLLEYWAHATAPTPVPDQEADITSHLYRIAKETVNNAIKHGAPNRISIHLRMEDDRLSLIVQDDGGGIPDNIPDQSTLGIDVMR